MSTLLDRLSANDPTLTVISYRGNANLNDRQALLNALRGNTVVTEIHMPYNRLDNVDSLCESLADLPLERLNLSYNPLGPDCAEPLRRLLASKGPKLLSVYLADCQLGDVGMERLCSQENRIAFTEYLVLSGNRITARGAGSVRTLLQEDLVGRLDLDHNILGDAGVAVLVEHGLGTTLHSLNLLRNQLGPNAATALARSLQMQPNGLLELNLIHNALGDQGVAILTQALTGNQESKSTLQRLYLDHNRIGNDGAAALAQALQDPQCSLQRLSLDSNAIHDTGAVALAKALVTNSTLSSLSLNGNPIAKQGGMAFAHTLRKHNHTLCELDWISVHMHEPSWREVDFYTRLNRMQEARALLCHSNPIPTALWVHVLEKVNHRADLLDYWIRETAVIWLHR